MLWNDLWYECKGGYWIISALSMYAILNKNVFIALKIFTDKPYKKFPISVEAETTRENRGLLHNILSYV